MKKRRIFYITDRNQEKIDFARSQKRYIGFFSQKFKASVVTIEANITPRQSKLIMGIELI